MRKKYLFKLCKKGRSFVFVCSYFRIDCYVKLKLKMEHKLELEIIKKETTATHCIRAANKSGC